MWPSYADNTFLPFARRRANTLRPFLVAMRARKPCTFLRLRTFGLKVGPIFTPPCNLVYLKDRTCLVETYQISIADITYKIKRCHHDLTEKCLWKTFSTLSRLFDKPSTSLSTIHNRVQKARCIMLPMWISVKSPLSRWFLFCYYEIALRG
jgi:hypothetical protein